MSWFPFFRWGNWGSEKFSNVPKVMDLAKALGWVLSVPKPFCCHCARPPWVMSVWLRNEKELMERPLHCSFHYFTLWMTNKQTLPQGICILKEELINPNESLIGRIVGGMFLSTGAFSCVFKVSGYPFLLCRLSAILESELCSRMQSQSAGLPQMQLHELTGSCKKNHLKEKRYELALYTMWRILKVSKNISYSILTSEML